MHYAFGALGELTSLQVNQHAPLQFSYNAVGQEYLRRSHAGFVNSSHYTATGLLAHQRAGRGTEQFLQSIQAHPQQPPFCTDVHRSYQYDRAYNVVGIEDDRWRQTRYHYNANDQITKTQYSPQWGNQDEKFQYDNNLNITEHLTTPSSSMVPSEAQGAMLQLFQQQQAGRVTRRYTAKGYQDYHYDVNGRLAKKIVHTRGFRPREWRYLWNTQNQLTACFTPKGDCWHYTYDAFGRRLSKTKTVDSDLAHIDPLFPQIKPKITTWRYLWSGDQLIEETPIYADGTLAESQQIQWLYQPGEITPTARYQQGKLHYVVTDHQGTPREIFSEGGQASWAGRLNTWGQMQFWRYREGKAENDPNYTECPFRFAGQYEDEESGLYYNRFRYYDKETGQYLSPDPIGLLGGLNPYGYVHCPTGWVDPFGLECCPGKITGDSKTLREKINLARSGDVSAQAELAYAKYMRDKGHNIHFNTPPNRSISMADFTVDGVQIDTKLLSGIGGNAAKNITKGVRQVGDNGVVQVIRNSDSPISLEQFQGFINGYKSPNPSVKVELIDQSVLKPYWDF
ncbi:TPA: RHS repeat-associated core domain-containing protein [Proteus mirabilis]|uniref:RHS repeat-associated core domain-containing protein n=1 Tax=Proteus mirabilis TaxID=584 RepID=UPI0022CF1A2C|nr:RHS repeat-associated core domain-containing protein [Proteus mirabilis]MDC5898215.1 RHS domain-containing protein [Proteus mirabilis]MDC5901691.1 RHS domain-containing protein [Proteus mirabilis]MDC5919347.1 RHS domain-containing protein [Proteus mirabilis]MDC5936904.1 RHS domain-containing protein [Proteus mirabilis]MDC6025416.1 RHS domain-containing protein [Proteus mirabilis]